MQYASYASAMCAPLSKIMLYRRFAIFCLWYTKYVMQWIASICLCTILTTMKKIICTNSEKLSENIQKAKKGKEKEFATLWNYETTGEKLKSVILVLNSPRSQQYSNIADSPSSSAISEFATRESFCAGCQWHHQAVPVCNWQTAAAVLERTFDGYLFKIIQMGLNPMVIITLM